MAKSISGCLRIETTQLDDRLVMNAISVVLAYLRHELLADLRKFALLFKKEMNAIGGVYRNSKSFW
jgi:hypothetical protein